MSEQDSPQPPGAGTGDGPAEPAPTPEPAAAPETSEGPGPVAAEPVPLEVPLEEQIRSLPPLEYPGSSQAEESRLFMEQKRRGRLRVEIIGGVLLVLAGAGAALVTQRTAFLVVALFAILALVAYEFLVDSFQ